MQKRIDEWIADIHKHIGKEYDVFDFYEHLTMTIIIDLAFGQNFDVEWMLPR